MTPAEQSKSIRKRKGWSQQELAEAVGLKYALSISQIELGKAQVSGPVQKHFDRLDAEDLTDERVE